MNQTIVGVEREKLAELWALRDDLRDLQIVKARQQATQLDVIERAKLEGATLGYELAGRWLEGVVERL